MPNSVLWVCLVAVWLFVLVPMVIKGRPQVKKSTDVARATRLLHRGGTRTRSARRRAAGSHPHDPEWKSQRRTTTRTAGATAVIDEADTERDDADTDLDAADLDVETGEKATEKTTVASEATDGVEDTATDAADSDAADSDAADSDADVLTGVVEDGADAADSDEDVRVTVTHVEIDVVEVEVDVIETVSAAGVEELTEDAEYEDDLAEDAEYDDDLDDDAEYDDYEDSEYEDSEYDEYEDDVDDADAEYDDDLEDDAEYDDDLDDEYDEYEDEEPVKPDTKKYEAEAEPAAAKAEKTTGRRSPYSPEAGADRLRYKERQRVSIGLIALVIVAVIAGVVLGTLGWIATGVTVLMLVGYLFYLRRTVKAEQQIRAQRAARARRAARAEAERLARQERVPEFAATPPPPRLRRPGGAVVLEIDDEDPVFDHLPPFQRRRVMREDPDFRQAVAG
ncbi:gephyrin-like molybdotransferase receptor GlpR [Gordonia sp. NB41Y]|uniref:divisome protein SepX/GlpR n=1 Tax=Gordonia sp. NB41Y TaxID=875808 RepID=UPI0006B18B1C|nr:gephyrin-like molybdotransferase receptor GlpR [Gordonia sp. NB41Y]KOY49740.1 hypothetical protein ISGA_08140 [Gordonia sp. NB41Y]WLP91857.1 hypothetical protein Q9K23_06320 [Gordonia sp. NB41Y]